MAAWALFFHILAGVLVFSGMVVAAVGFELARRRQRPSEVALLLHASRIGARLVSAGMVAVVALGLWLVELRGHAVTEPWIVAALLLLVLATTAGIVAGSVRNKLGGSR